MVWRDPALEAPTIPEDERYDGTELDSNILKGKVEELSFSGTHNLS